MQKLQQYASDRGVIWLTVNSGAPGREGFMDAAAAEAKVAEVGGHEAAYILDPDGTLGQLYGAKTTPHMFVINPDGVLIYAGGIDDKPSADSDDIATAKNYVVQALDESMAGKPVTVTTARPYGCSVKYANSN